MTLSDPSVPADMWADESLPSVAIESPVPPAASVFVEADTAVRERYAARWVAAALDAVIQRRNRAVLGLVGGSSVAGVHRTLLDVDVDWSRVIITQADERAVPADSPERNWRVIEPLVDPLLADGRLPAANVQSLVDLPSDTTPEMLETALAPLRTAVDRIDVALLGLGPDGHVASLFPHHACLGTAGSFQVVTDSPKPPPLRMSATVSMLAGADATAVVGFGDGKAEAVAAITSTGPLADAPGRIVHLAGRGVIVTDRIPAT
ncbi:MAG TPA: 6-phosphogluconolactonase [Nitriliruptoraceae bacterium]|nr:6-phosphogluconolactonase [Nitriliruptoraceae bacterium]